MVRGGDGARNIQSRGWRCAAEARVQHQPSQLLHGQRRRAIRRDGGRVESGRDPLAKIRGSGDAQHGPDRARLRIEDEAGDRSGHTGRGLRPAGNRERAKRDEKPASVHMFR